MLTRLVVRLDVDRTRLNRSRRRFGYLRLIARHICNGVGDVGGVERDWLVLASARIVERALEAWKRHSAIIINHGAFKQVTINQVAGFHGSNHVRIVRAIVGLIRCDHGDGDLFRGYGKFLRAGAAQVVVRLGNRGRDGVCARLRWGIGRWPEGRLSAGRAAIGIGHHAVAGVAGNAGRLGRLAVGPPFDGDAGADARLVDRDGIRYRRADILTRGIARLVPCHDHGGAGALDRDGHHVRMRVCDLEHVGVAAVPVPVAVLGGHLIARCLVFRDSCHGEGVVAIGLGAGDALYGHRLLFPLRGHHDDVDGRVLVVLGSHGHGQGDFPHGLGNVGCR